MRPNRQFSNLGFMTPIDILAYIGGTVLVLQATIQVTGALTDLLRSCKKVITAARDLRSSAINDEGEGVQADSVRAVEDSRTLPAQTTPCR